MSRVATVIGALAILVVLAACETRVEQGWKRWTYLGEGFGDASQTNMALQVIDPEPSDAADYMHGDRAYLALTRYRTGKVTEPEEIRTTTTVGGGGTTAQ